MVNYNENKPYIFVSYSHKDREKVYEIIDRLMKNGYNVWYDEGIDPGTEWDENIARHVKNCSYFIAFVSENYLSSNNCKDELNYSRDLNKEQLLVYLEKVDLPSGMAMRMNRLQAIWWNKYDNNNIEEAYEKLLSASGIEKTKISADGGKGIITKETITEASASPNTNVAAKAKKPLDKRIIIGAGVLAAVIIILCVVLLGNKKDNTAGVENKAAETLATEEVSENAKAEEISEGVEAVENEETNVEAMDTGNTEAAEVADTEENDSNSDTSEGIAYENVVIEGNKEDVPTVVFEIPSSIGYTGYPNIRAKTITNELNTYNNHAWEGYFLFNNFSLEILENPDKAKRFNAGYAAYDENDNLVYYHEVLIENVNGERVDVLASDEERADEELTIGSRYRAYGWIPTATRRVRFFAENPNGEDCYTKRQFDEEMNRLKDKSEFNVKSEFGDLIVETHGMTKDTRSDATGFLLSVQNPVDKDENTYTVDVYIKIESGKENAENNKSLFGIKTVYYDSKKVVDVNVNKDCHIDFVDQEVIKSNSIYKATVDIKKGTSILSLCNYDCDDWYYIKDNTVTLKDGTEKTVTVWEGYPYAGSYDDNEFRFRIVPTGIKVSESDESLMTASFHVSKIHNPNNSEKFNLKYDCINDKGEIIKHSGVKIDGFGDKKEFDFEYPFPIETRIIHIYGNEPDGKDVFVE